MEYLLIRNHLSIPYSYFSLLVRQQNRSQTLTAHNFDLQAYVYRIKGMTTLHDLVLNYNSLEFCLKKYLEHNAEYANMVLLRNYKGETPLHMALYYHNHRSVNLILKVLESISINNSFIFKDIFSELLNFGAFAEYLSVCYF